MATNPTLLTMPIAENGQKNTIPETQAAAGDGLLSQSTGFPPETALPLGAGGVAPSREDFNGAFNLVSGISYYAQKGWFFFFDNTQSYFKGCVVRDATDDKLYECLNDVAAGGSVPSADSTNWRVFSTGGVPLGSILPYSANAQTPPYGFLFCEGQAIARTMYPDLFDLIGTSYGEGNGSTTFNLPNLIDAAMLNGSYTKTSYTAAGSATFTASKTGWYKITVKGGGGGGGGGYHNGTTYTVGGVGGGEGGTTIAYERMTAGETAAVVIGAGGAGGAAGSTLGNDGGDSSVTVNNNTYTGGGASGLGGGTGTIPGNPGNPRRVQSVSYATMTIGGSPGGGAGGGRSATVGSAGINGGGGSGGGVNSSGTDGAGGNGGDGYVTIEYIGVSMQYILKAYDAPTPSSAQIDLSQYASDLANRLTREQTPAFNKRDVITTSVTYTAPVTGWYRIVVKGGGGGGMGSYHNGTTNGFGGAGGGEGGTTIAYEHLTAGDTAAVVIGAGGTAGQSGVNSSANYGTAGGDSSVTVNNNTYTGGGGNGGGLDTSGGTGTIIGAPGGGRHQLIGSYGAYGIGGGVGGGAGGGSVNKAGVTGGGGGGASVTSVGNYGDAGAGGDGYAWFEYFDGSLN